MANISDVTDDDLKMWSIFLEQVMLIDNPNTKFIYMIVMFGIFFVSLFGNLLTCFVIYVDKTMHTATNYYLFNLAAADLMLTISVLIEVMARLIYPSSKILCLIQWFSVGCLWNNSILIMTALSIERYMAVWHPLMLKSSAVGRRVKRTIVFLWIVAIIETLPEMLIVDIIKTQQSGVCFSVPSHLARIVNGVLVSLTFIFPLFIMIFVYSAIIFKVNAKYKENSRYNVFNNRNHRDKITWLMMAMTISFFVCWLPFNTVRILVCVLNVKQLFCLGKWWCMIFSLVNVNSWFSSVMNPILFSLMSTKFRKSLKAIWDRKSRDNLTKHDVPTNNKRRSGRSPRTEGSVPLMQLFHVSRK